MSELAFDFSLRLAKVLVGLAIAVILWLVATGPLGATGSVELALLCWLSGAALVLVVQSSPL